MLYLILTWLAAPLLWLRVLASRQPAAPARILLIQTAKIGDFVCTTPVIRAIRQSWPEAKLTVLIHPVNQPLARHNPHIDEVLTLPAHGLRGLGGRLWLIRQMRQRHIDTSICLSPSAAAWLAPFWAGVARRASVGPNYGGRSYRMARAFLTHVEAHRTEHRLLDTEFSLLSRLGGRDAGYAADAFPSPDAHTDATRTLPQFDGHYVGLGVSAANKLKELGADRLISLARELLKDNRIRLVLVGGPGDRELGTQVDSQLNSQRVIDTTGRFSLDALPALLARLTAYIGVDSGITYLADACTVPVVAFMGPADPVEQRPGNAEAIILKCDLPCHPCAHVFQAPYHCRLGTRACILEQSLDPIAASVIAIIDRKTPVVARSQTPAP